MSSSITHVISSTSTAIHSCVLNADPRGLPRRRERGGSEGDGKHEEAGVKKAKKPHVLLPTRMNYSADDSSQNVIFTSSQQQGLVSVDVGNKVGTDDSLEES